MNDPRSSTSQQRIGPVPSGRVFDVVRPGRVLASPTSRPVIVGHKPQVQDTIIGGEAQSIEDSRRQLMDSREKVSLQPEPKNSVQNNQYDGVAVHLSSMEGGGSDDASTPLSPSFGHSQASNAPPQDTATIPTIHIPPQQQPTTEELLRMGAVATDSLSATATNVGQTKTSKRQMPWWEIMLVIFFVVAFAGFGIFVALNVFGVIR